MLATDPTAIASPATDHIQSMFNSAMEEKGLDWKRNQDTGRGQSAELCGPQSPFKFKTMQQGKR